MAQPSNEKKKDFVSFMLDKANSEDSVAKPNVNNEDVKSIENMAESIKRRIRQGQ